MKQPAVSVVVATYRQEEALCRGLESLIRQTYDNFEIILVDDNDDYIRNKKIREMTEQFRLRCPQIPITYIGNHPHLGSAETRNAGIAQATGTYVAFLDDDDLYLPEKLMRQVTAMEQENADFGITDLYLYHENGNVADKRIRSYIEKTDKDSLMKYHMKYHMTGTDSLMFRRDYLNQIGGFDPIDLGDEFYLMAKAIAGGGKLCYVPGCDIKAFVHNGKTGLSGGQNKIDCENQLFAFKKKHLKEFGRHDRHYIYMRHYAVLAFAGLRMHRLGFAAYNGVLSFLHQPFACCSLIVKRKF